MNCDSYHDEDKRLFENSPLVQSRSLTPPDTESDIITQGASYGRRHCGHCDPGNAILVVSMAGSGPHHIQMHHDHCDTASERSPSVSVKEESVADTAGRHDSGIDDKALPAAALATSAASERADTTSESQRGPAPARLESAREDMSKQSPEDRPTQLQDDRASHAHSRSPLKLETNAAYPRMAPTFIGANTASPKFKDRVFPVPESSARSVAAPQAPSTQDVGGTTSPRSARLPSFKELSEGVEAAAPQAPRPYAHQPSHSFSSPAAQSPKGVFRAPFAPSVQSSPASHYGMSARSPTNTMADAAHMPYSSPPQYSPYYPERRASIATEGGSAPYLGVPPSASTSSGDSHGRSSIDGYSTSQTTPIEHGATESGPRPLVAPSADVRQGGVAVNSTFRCNWPACESAFPTQYLLSSHKKRHSTERPFHCPVEGCKRGVNGNGFKRKNELNRHALVHQSPGYSCPFCPDREHKYPRPDNLQRHVRVHHDAKCVDDPVLREVLAQRTEGTGKYRRRRGANAPDAS